MNKTKFAVQNSGIGNRGKKRERKKSLNIFILIVISEAIRL
jgi:hypothetical protein